MIAHKIVKVAGLDIDVYTLSNDDLEVNCISYGATLQKFYKRRNDEMQNLVLGYDCLENYLENPSYAGMTVGRCAGRIEKGEIYVEGERYQLSVNNGKNHLHGNGALSFVCYNSRVVGENCVEFYIKDEDGSNGYPSEIDVVVRYTLKNSSLVIEYEARAKEPTFINMTGHSYFNPGLGVENGDELYLKLQSDYVYEVDEDLIPKGSKLEVAGTSFDFREYRRIGDNIELGHKQFDYTRAIDHPFMLRERDEWQVDLYSAKTGVGICVKSNQDVAVIYTGNYLDEVKSFIEGDANPRFMGVAIEMQALPNAMNVEGYELPLVKKDKPYYSRIEFEVYEKDRLGE